MKQLKYLLLACLLLSACSQNNSGEDKPQNTTPSIVQTEPVVTTTTTTVVTTTPKITTSITTATPEVKELITEYMGMPINLFNDDAYLETDLFKPFIIDGRFQSVGEDKTLYVWYSHCTEDNYYFLPMMPGGRVGCTLLNEKATNDMIDIEPFLEAVKYGEYTYKYLYDFDEPIEIDTTTYEEIMKAFEGYIQFPDYFMYYSDEYVDLEYPFVISIENNNDKIKFRLNCIFEHGFTFEVVSTSEDLIINDKLGTFAKFYVPKENAKEFILELINNLSKSPEPNISNEVSLIEFNNNYFLDIPDISIYVKDGVLSELNSTEISLFHVNESICLEDFYGEYEKSWGSCSLIDDSLLTIKDFQYYLPDKSELLQVSRTNLDKGKIEYIEYSMSSLIELLNSSEYISNLPIEFKLNENNELCYRKDKVDIEYIFDENKKRVYSFRRINEEGFYLTIYDYEEIGTDSEIEILSFTYFKNINYFDETYYSNRM